MFEHRELGLVQAYQIGSAIILAAVFWSYFAILNKCIPDFSLAGVQNYFEYLLCIELAFQISFLRARQKDIFSITSGLLESHSFIWPHVVFSGAITCMFLVLTKDTTISRLFLFTYLPIAYLTLIIFSRYFALGVFQRFLRYRSQRLLLVGNAEQVVNVAKLLTKAEIFGFEAIGLATDAEEKDIPGDMPKLGGVHDLETILHKHHIDSILILGSPKDRRQLGGWMRQAEAHGCRLSMVNDLDVFLQRRLCYFSCDGLDMIELRQEPLQNLVNRLSKRAVDFVVSIGVVGLLLPVLIALVWFMQRRQAPGPLFFRQVRSGLDNHHFTIIKFRTMYADRCDSANQVTTTDDRIFPAGRWMRRFSIDEFPQFINVFRGDMSLVGPRPHMLQHDKFFADKMGSYRVRGFVKPGLTGLAQINGFRGEAATQEAIVRRVESDLEYIETWSLSLDVRIVWRTIIHLFKPPKTAY